MGISTKYRTQQTEIMDDFSLEGEELRDALDKIARINYLLGGNKLTLNGVKQLLKKTNMPKTITIADVGCGNGDILRMLSEYGKKRTINFRLIGIDANLFTINYAKSLSDNYSNIEYECMDIFSEDFNRLKCDIILCTLTLHHFSNDQIQNIITTFNSIVTTGIVVNDLQRSKLAYRLFGAISGLLNLNDMSREDGLVSILRGFKRQELVDFSKKINLRNYTIKWKWAFRYQWIIVKS